MRNEDVPRESRARIARVLRGLTAIACVGFACSVLADDPASPPQNAPATRPDAQVPPAKPPTAGAPTPSSKKGEQDTDDSGDYDKNATKRFTPSERTPADRNVSFPVDI